MLSQLFTYICHDAEITHFKVDKILHMEYLSYFLLLKNSLLSDLTTQCIAWDVFPKYKQVGSTYTHQRVFGHSSASESAQYGSTKAALLACFLNPLKHESQLR